MTALREPEIPAPPTVADVEQAVARLHGIIRTTPITSSDVLARALGCPVLLKHEEHQRTGSFKLRGAYNRIAQLSLDDQARGVVAASAGNHAQGVALASSLLGITSRVFMPTSAPLPKIEATRGYGAEVVLVGSSVEEALVAAREFADESGAVLIHPFDHPDVIAGQATIGVEIDEQCAELGTVLVPVGGGGLIAGVAMALRAARPQVRIVGVQAAGAAAFAESLWAGQRRRGAEVMTMADGIAVALPGELTFAMAREQVDEMVTVSEASISRALLVLLERTKRVVEPAGAVAVAAILDRADRRAAGGEALTEWPAPVLAVLSGGNIDPVLLMRVVRHGMAAAGRYLPLSLTLPDRPGALASLLGLLADLGANVLEVEHVRHGVGMSVDEVIVALRLETLGAEHSDRVLEAVAQCGYLRRP